MVVLVYDKDISDISGEETKKNSNYVICPICHEDSRICIKEKSKIKLYGCKNKHSKDNIIIDEFQNIQIIDESTIICNICKKSNKNETFNNKFYFCIDCISNICVICNQSHNKEHNIIDYDKKNFICFLHNELYNSFCKTCEKDICLICENEHNNHEIIYYSKLMPKKENLENQKKRTKECLNKFINEIKNKIKYLNKLKENLELYYIKNRNYIILQNINYINSYNDKLIVNLNEIIDNDEININYILNELVDEFKIKNPNKIETISFEKYYKNKNPDDCYFYFNINKIDNYESKSFKTKTDNKRLFLLEDGRLLSLDENTISVYDLNNNNNLDIFDSIPFIFQIIQMDDRKLIFYKDGLKTLNISKRSYNIQEINTVDDNNYRWEYLSTIYKLSDSTILIYRKSKLFFYSYEKDKVNYIKSIYIEKQWINDICKINNHEIAIICSDEGMIYGNYYYLIFYDIEKEKEIVSKKLGSYYSLCLISEDRLIIGCERKFKLMDLKEYEFINEINVNINNISSFLILNEFSFLCFTDSKIVYQYNIHHDIEAGENIKEEGSKCIYNYAIKYGDKLIFGNNNEIKLIISWRN